MDIGALLEGEIGSYAEAEWSGELNGTTLTLTAKPLTPADMQFVEKMHKGFSTNPTTDGMIDLIIRKARYNGETAFVKGKHFALLNRVKVNKIGEIFGALFGDQVTAEDEAALDERAGK
jgi:hypothetical protein